MTCVEKLLIKGIRSFSPHNEDPIEFGEPLSLIVGHNGAGKTTIIECLKQATTGAMPPNSQNGKNFVHDTEVRLPRQ
jgi:DNA repair protein RAD50